MIHKEDTTEAHTTNIAEDDVVLFKNIISGEFKDQLALVSCFFDNEPANVIASVTLTPNGNYAIAPVYLQLNDDLMDKLTNHEDEKLVSLESLGES